MKINRGLCGTLFDPFGFTAFVSSKYVKRMELPCPGLYALKFGTGYSKSEMFLESNVRYF